MQTKFLHMNKIGKLEVELAEGEVLERYDALAREALDECRKTTTMALRFLSGALWHMPHERAPLFRTLSTNGRVVRYDPERVVDRYRDDANELVRDCIHETLHCVFHHPFETRHGEYAAWSLACDVCVELCAIELCGERFPSKLDIERLEAAQRLLSIARNKTAPALYQVLRSGEPGEVLYESYGLTSADLDELAQLFGRDAHDLWAVHPRFDDAPGSSAEGESQAVPDLQGGGEGSARSSAGAVAGSSDSDSSGGEGDDGAQDGLSKEWNAAPAPPDGAQPPEESQSSVQDELQEDDEAMREGEQAGADERLLQTLDEWRSISKRVEAEMRAQQHSLAGAGSMLQNLTVANRKPVDYDEFLRRFATIAEDMRVSDDEFDYIYYTYGMSRYGNIPLVEPLEYRESNRVREFVIALDTSGSCSGELIRTFVARTYDILRQKTSFGDEINVHLVQCDNRVRTAAKVTSLRQLEEYGDSFWVSGGGGTDFKPVFQYVDALVEDGEFNDLRGLIYFTDGYGAFPAKAPDYDVAFVFVDCEDTSVRVPAWAMKVIMTQEEVRAWEGDEAKGTVPFASLPRLEDES